MQYKLRVASGLKLPWYGSMEWNMEENFSKEWSMEWKKIVRMEYGKIVFHTMPWQEKHSSYFLYLTSYGLL